MPGERLQINIECTNFYSSMAQEIEGAWITKFLSGRQCLQSIATTMILKIHRFFILKTQFTTSKTEKGEGREKNIVTPWFFWKFNKRHRNFYRCGFKFFLIDIFRQIQWNFLELEEFIKVKLIIFI